MTQGVVVNTTPLYTVSPDLRALGKLNGQNFPPGTIVVQKMQKGPKSNLGASLTYAFPLELSDYATPLKGEHVWLYSSPDGSGRPTNRWYYSKIVNVHNTLNTNSLPDIYDLTVQPSNISSYQQGGIRMVTGEAPQLEYISHTEREVAPLQPYEGDRLISSRYGSAIRFSSNINKGQSNYFKSNPPWKGSGTNSPIMMLTSGLANSNEFYTIEKPDEDKSYIYIASDQSITMTTAQQKIGTARSPSNYTNGQIIIGSDRLFFNARRDDITLVSKSTVNIATSNWAADMDKFFTQVERIQEQLTKLTAQVSTLSSALVASSAADIIPGIIPGALILNPVANSITSQVGTISTELSNISTTLASLKQ
jgi:hypothetical protein